MAAAADAAGAVARAGTARTKQPLAIGAASAGAPMAGCLDSSEINTVERSLRS